MMLKKISGVSLVDEAAGQLQGLILNGTLHLGDRFPTETELCAQLGVSRTVIREAKKSLVGSGLIETRGRQGTFVRDEIPGSLIETMSLGLGTDKATIRELMEARRIVEVAAAGMAAERALASAREALADLQEQVENAVKTGDMAAFAQIDLAWHAAVAEASQNRLVSRMVSTTRSLLRKFIELVLQVPGSDLAAANDHRRVTEAILTGDVEAAKAAMTNHLDDVEGMILQRLG